MPPFQVVLEDAGVELVDGDPIEVHLGCQGGAHVFLDVVVRGDDLERPTLTIEAPGGLPLSDMLSVAGGRAEARGAMVIVAQSVPPGGYPYGAELTLRATVRTRRGTVTIARRLIATAGGACDSTCSYDSTDGSLALAAVSPPRESGCTLEVVALTGDYTIGDAIERDRRVDATVPPACREVLGLRPGGQVAVRRQLLRTGTCTPLIEEVQFDRAACAAICPGF